MSKKEKTEISELSVHEDKKPKLTSKVDKDGNYVFDPEKVREMLKWVIKKSSRDKN